VPNKKQKQIAEPVRKRNGPVPYDVRVRIVQAVMRGTRQADVAVAFGVSVAVIQKFLTLFDSGGMEALRLNQRGARSDTTSSRPRGRTAPVAEVVAARAANPEWGTRRIRDVLARFEGLGVSETTVRRVLHEAGLLLPQTYEAPREKPPRRFERAEPNQMWQTDLFQFELRRNHRVYVVAFMDDYSRYLVSWAMAHHQKSSLVIEALERGIAEYGEPHEVLTDQGRQYAAWRGETEFQQLLRRRGINHSKSRPQHPETLGKIERFWKTLWEEFLRKTVFADFEDCVKRVGLFVQHYNFQRPHQGIDGSVPADRFFRAAPHVRAAIEAQVQQNALRLAQEKPPQKPFYLVGRLGDQDLSIAAAGGALRVQVGDASQTIPMKEIDDETTASRAFQIDEEATDASTEREADRGAPGDPAPVAGAQHLDAARTPPDAVTEAHDEEEAIDDIDEDDQSRSSTRAASTWRAALADWSQGFRSGRAAPNAADLVRALGTYAGDDGDHRARHLTSALLPARDEGASRDDASVDSGYERDLNSRRRDTAAAAGGAGREGSAPGARESPTGAPAVFRAQGTADGAGGDAGEAGAQAGTSLDGRWARTFAWLEEDDGHSDATSFDPDHGWRDRAVRWTRKLAGADAPHEAQNDGESARAERIVDVPEPTVGADGAQTSLRGNQGGTGRTDDDQRGRDRTVDRSREHAVADPSRRSSHPRDLDASPQRSDTEVIDGEASCREGEAARGAEREADDAAASGGRYDDGSGGNHPESAGTTADLFENLLLALEAADQDTELRRGSRTSNPVSAEARARDASEEE
jgi:transposase InsO family protein